MLAELTAACELWSAAIFATDPDVLTGGECAQVVEMLARSERRSAALRLLAAARAVDCQAHKARGFSSPTRWLADTTGTTTGEATTAFNTVKGLAACPRTAEALRRGEVSVAQAAEITKTEAAAPGGEAQLLELAASASVNELRETARGCRPAARRTCAAASWRPALSGTGPTNTASPATAAHYPRRQASRSSTASTTRPTASTAPPARRAGATSSPKRGNGWRRTRSSTW